MELLAAGAEALTSGPSQSSFLQRADNLLEDATVKLRWREEGMENSRFLSSSNSWRNDDSLEPKARYLSQQFVERLCSSAGLAVELRQEMERVVFDATDQGDRMQCESFQELAQLLLTPPSEARAEFQTSIGEIGDEVIKEDQLRAQIPELAKSIKAQNELIAGVKKEQNELLPVKHTIDSREPARFLELKRKYSGAQLRSDDWESFRMAFVGDVQMIVQRALADLDRSIKGASFGDPAKPVETSKTPESSLPLSKLRELRDAARKDVGIDDERQKKYGELQRALTQAEGTLRRLEEEEKHAKGASDRRNELIRRRRNEYVEVFKTFLQEEQALADLYSPLRKRLTDSEGTLGKLGFIVEREVRLDDWVSKGEELIDLRRDSSFRGHGALKKHAERPRNSSRRNGEVSAGAVE
jgi:hypothetical protein